MVLLNILIIAAAILMAIPAMCLLTLTLAAGMRQRNDASAAELPQQPRVAILVPAHNESVHVLPTIQCLLPQLMPGDHLLVIADNCTDDTAALARQAGATVLERHNPTQRGKGYALAFGVDALRADPPDVVVVVDADCTVSDDAIAQVSARSIQTDGPIQMLNLMHAPRGASLRIRVLEFAWLVKNLVRPLGSCRLGGACHLMGTGMAIPWKLLSTAQLASGHITEDMKLGIDMAVAGHPAQLFMGAQVKSFFPTDPSIVKAQKSRWEHGHLQTLTQDFPSLLKLALHKRSLSLGALAVDLVIPPLALYFLLLAIMVPLAILARVLDPMWQPFAAVILSATLVFGLAIGMAWWRYARHLLSVRELFSTPLYALWKIPVYIAYAVRKRSGWVRTEREKLL
jgi:cellulose synthase/poly-beta-1,6-N-acetylglucosamine synthase-like glycosyltransferase